jgi:adenosylhomocysteinase
MIAARNSRCTHPYAGRVSNPRDQALQLLRRFAAATNLLVAGRTFALHGIADDVNAQLERAFLALGARRWLGSGSLDYLFCTGDAPADFGPWLTGGPRPLVVVGDMPDGGVQARPGVRLIIVDGYDVAVVSSSVTEPPVPSATDGADRIRWARRFMPVSRALSQELAALGPFIQGVRVGISMVLEPKTAVLALLLAEAGAETIVFAHPDETDNAVADALRAEGLVVFADSSATRAEHRAYALDFLDSELDLLLDDGSALIRLAHLERPEAVERLRGAAEETTSGLRPLRTMHEQGSLRLPVVAVNDARSKTQFDNLYGTGQSCVFAILDLLERSGHNDSLIGKSVVIAGFGPVGEGVARHCAALGARVTIAETDAVRALRATFEGYEVAQLITAVASADLVISATGIADTISLTTLLACAPEAVIAVAGGVPQEIAIDDAVAAGAIRETLAPKLERFHLPGGGTVRILDDGGCINITAGEGNPIEIMDLSFAVQLAAVRTLLEREWSVGLHPLPADVDNRVAAAALGATTIDTVTDSQREFLADWYPTRFDRPATEGTPTE